MQRRSLCLVCNDFDYVLRNGGIGTYNWLMAHLLAGTGWYVHVLYCGDVRRRESRRMAARLAEVGIGWSALDDFPVSPLLKLTGITDIFNLELSERTRHALEELHQHHHFDLVEFAEWGGLGFRSIQARRAGVAFTDLPMAVKLHSSSQWMREGNHQWLADHGELEVDYCERYSFEHADVQLSPSQYMFEYVRSIGWVVRPDAQVVPYPYPEPLAVPAAGPTERPELVFFGRLETRKGLDVFLRAAGDLDPAIPLTFLGRVNKLADGRPATELIRERLGHRPYRLLTGYNREQALAYLAAGNRLAVIASLADNSPFTVIECITNRIPFIASRVGGIPELLRDPEGQQRLLFQPNSRDLLRCLRDYLAADPATLHELRHRLQEQLDLTLNRQTIADAYEAITEPSSRATSVAAPAASDPLVSVAVAHYNLGAYLPETLASLAAQTYRNLEVLVLDDGSTDPVAQEVLIEMQQQHPQFHFLHHPNSGIGATRNRGLQEARGEFFIPMDADNIACPHMVETFVRAIQRNPSLAAMTCYCLAFEETSDIDREDFRYAYRPTGGPHVLASIKNIYGDANAIFRTAMFRSTGYETDRDCSWEDLEAFVKLVNAGHKIDTVPEVLFYYRHLETGFSRITDSYLNQRRVLRQYFGLAHLPTAEGIALWTALVGLQKRTDALTSRLTSLRYRVADGVHALFAHVPVVKSGVRWLLRSGGRAWKLLTAGASRRPSRRR
jgi:GT2 family glycosyltransferase/glycosyltransferase involved in cell wall biosynthesis